eukprot:20668-Heterococcus_DN1.PRE.3
MACLSMQLAGTKSTRELQCSTYYTASVIMMQQYSSRLLCYMLVLHNSVLAIQQTLYSIWSMSHTAAAVASVRCCHDQCRAVAQGRQGACSEGSTAHPGAETVHLTTAAAAAATAAVTDAGAVMTAVLTAAAVAAAAVLAASAAGAAVSVVGTMAAAAAAAAAVEQA